MKSYAQWLQSLVDDLNYDTLIEEPWSVEFIDTNGKFQIIGNSRVSMTKKNGIWIFALDKEKAEFPEIRSYLEKAQTIFKVNRIARNGNGKADLPTHYERAFRNDAFMDEQGEMAVPSILGFRGRFDTTQYIMLEDGLITTISERIA